MITRTTSMPPEGNTAQSASLGRLDTTMATVVQLLRSVKERCQREAQETTTREAGEAEQAE
jgi:hypothetical protein